MKKFFFIIALIAISFSVSPLYAQEKQEEKTPIVEEVEADIKLPEMHVLNNVLYVKNAPVGSKIEIITILGSKVREIKLKSSDISYELDLPKAIYIFKLNGMVRKFVVR